jgi:hypothetical protein
MSIARKLVLLAGLAISALALTASSASGQETMVEVVEEEGHVPCVECPIHLAGETVIRNEAGNVTSTCEDEFEGVIDADGKGDLEWVGSAHGAPGCNVVNCVAPEDHWPFGALDELAAGTTHIYLRLCFSAAGNENDCVVEIQITDTGLHDYLASLASQECPAGPGGVGHAFLTGSWTFETETHTSLEFEHHDL